ncbi:MULTISPECIES: IclR family transcriptional regulator [Actinomycetes]|jgi:IclR family acetate operon transcriptional repressor|nr:IclR family transcriptional regulator [Nocardioides currus]
MRKVQIDHRRPRYAIDSIDHALRTLHLLRDTGAVRVSDVALKLGIAPSTAHRIMAMLVYQGFAVQDDSRRYLAGPALWAPVMTSQRTATLIEVARPILEDLSREVGEIINLSVRVGVHSRVLLTVGDLDPTADDDRTGRVYPAHSSASGRALLALEPDALLERLFVGRSAKAYGSALTKADLDELATEIAETRRRGFAVCDEEVQRGVAGVAVPVSTPDGSACTIVVLLPHGRLKQLRRDVGKIDLLFAAKRRLSESLVGAVGNNGLVE